jgi:hypothetical protein
MVVSKPETSTDSQQQPSDQEIEDTTTNQENPTRNDPIPQGIDSFTYIEILNKPTRHQKLVKMVQNSMWGKMGNNGGT